MALVNPLEAAQSFLTLRDILRFASGRFQATELFYGHGTTSAHEEAIYLLLSRLSLSHNQLDAYLDAKLLPSEINQLLHDIEMRITQRKPIAYLTQQAWQGDYTFYVDERVIIPRSFIPRLLGDTIAAWLKPEQVHYALDLCTGSGCLAIQMADCYPHAKIDAVDISLEALEVATINVARYRFEQSIRLIQSDLFSQLKPPALYDLIICNPPYVSADNMSHLPTEYKHEPVLALHAEEDGLAIILNVLRQAAYFLSEEGILLMEVGSCRTLLEERYPIAWLWLDTPEDTGAVCLLTQADLEQWQNLASLANPS